ncbi:antitoxin, partial [Escherichia coli]|uniref:antitoxin n=1 Tax=Escherichia coli TaxID=562 RepID=UPI00375483B2
MSNNPQQSNGGEYVDKARDAARDHPDQARGAIDKVQEAVDKRTGGKFTSIIDKAGDFVEDKLGLPED